MIYYLSFDLLKVYYLFNNLTIADLGFEFELSFYPF